MLYIIVKLKTLRNRKTDTTIKCNVFVPLKFVVEFLKSFVFLSSLQTIIPVKALPVGPDVTSRRRASVRAPCAAYE
jgi:hypothetical protein